MDEDDVALIDALHVNPRASFEQLGAALGVSAVTTARRWRRLSAAGQAWISSIPGPNLAVAGALFEAECVPGQAQRAAEALAAQPQVSSVHVTGPSDVYAFVVAADHQLLSRLLLEELTRVPGLLRGRGSMVTEVFSGARWRLGAISARQAGEIRAGCEDSEPGTDQAARGMDEFERTLFLAFQHDGRAGYRELAVLTSRSEQSVKRRVNALIRCNLLAFRTDFARPKVGWNLQIALWLNIPDDHLHHVGAQLGSWPQTRVCAAVVGDANLFATLQLHSLEELADILARMRKTWPYIEVTGRQVVLRPVKSWGRLLGPDGCCVGVVPVDPWAISDPGS